MTRLLVSVRNAAEAGEALAAGAHFLDVKEPARGPLGRADALVWRGVQSAVPASCPLSAALGELKDFPAQQMASLRGFRFAKIGLAGCGSQAGWWHPWRAALCRYPTGVGAVAVAYADHHAARAPTPEEVLHIGRLLGCTAFLIDTFDKRAGSLFAHYPPHRLAPLVDQAHAREMLVVLAGSLREDCLMSAAASGADYVAVRGAVCAGGRGGKLDGATVRRWVERLAGCAASSAPP